MVVWLRRYSFLLLFFCVSGCIEPFEPKVTDKSTDYLVVDGAINSQGMTVIRLSRTTGLAQNAKVPIEGKARVFIEEEAGKQYPLLEGPVGTYTSAALTLPAGKAVRLHFTTVGGREYASDFTPVKTTPAIDSVTWRARQEGVQIYVNAHDDTQQSRYYRWTYDETWEFTSGFLSVIKYDRGNMVYRTASEDIYHCWSSAVSTAIKLGTTTKLGQDVVSQQPITLLPPNSTKLRYKYSILVKQYAQTLEEYQYWEALRKNTENIGTLFDPLPTQTVGNVHNLANKSEVVIGFVGAQSVTEKRIFIDEARLPHDWTYITGYENCIVPDTMERPFTGGGAAVPLTQQQKIDFFKAGVDIPIDEYVRPGTSTVNYLYSTAECVDCRRRGTNVRPSFWR
ncbi:protein of unknown function [Hymenobacter gelipurpurascens]|uniref:DUF4249 domain-containing protein n=1 Tax=Hymenobacter gelipurpurascens TaxID=89968 RepID=A0A212UAF5_9BACT|nr:DUF4249 domain-containing protein [Hymenobacter gelipurpurascens]SNC75176.1 protein of unknown function [Hymenobacter gelipurpurascens]